MSAAVAVSLFDLILQFGVGSLAFWLVGGPRREWHSVGDHGMIAAGVSSSGKQRTLLDGVIVPVKGKHLPDDRLEFNRAQAALRGPA